MPDRCKMGTDLMRFSCDQMDLQKGKPALILPDRYYACLDIRSTGKACLPQGYFICFFIFCQIACQRDLFID